jgi:CubicO group peptidase (beta-lactamase class C family)
MKKTVISLMLIIIFLASNGQNHYSISEKKRLDKRKLDKIHEHIVDNIKTGSIPGAVVLVAQKGKILHYEATGYSDIESGKVLTKDNVFRMASMSKPITGVAVLLLIDQGKISLNDPLSKYIPQFKNMRVATTKKHTSEQDYQPDPNAPADRVSSMVRYNTVPANREITIKDLLTHSSGIGQGQISSSEIYKIPREIYENLAVYIPKLANAPLEFQPGTSTGYSPLSGFEILGRVVEVVSGETLDKFLSNHLFKPLEMKNTGFGNFQKSVSKKIPVMYKRTDKGLIRDTVQQSTFIDSVYFSGAAGMVSTIEDYYHFAQMLMNGGTYKGKRIISREIINQMSTPQLSDTIKYFSSDQTWGLSVRVVTSDNGSAAPLTKGCFGWSGAWGTHFWIDPVHKIVAIYMTNVSNIGGAGANTARELERDVMNALIE